MNKTHLVGVGLAVAAATAGVMPARAGFNYSDKDREARWQELRPQIFGTRVPRVDDAAVRLEAPDTALDAALVPVTITLADAKNVAKLYLVIDDNPSPLAARIAFGPEADPHQIKLRVRINHVTNVHAVAEMKDGALIQTARLIKASGGCSAPMGVSDEEAMRGMGEMKVKVADEVAVGRPVEATLMIRHPNFNGMQMNEALQVFTPARYIQTIDVTFDNKQVVKIDTDISLSSNPVIAFDLLPSAAKGDLKVAVRDSKAGQWSKTFPLPNVGN